MARPSLRLRHRPYDRSALSREMSSHRSSRYVDGKGCFHQACLELRYVAFKEALEPPPFIPPSANESDRLGSNGMPDLIRAETKLRTPTLRHTETYCTLTPTLRCISTQPNP